MKNKKAFVIDLFLLSFCLLPSCYKQSHTNCNELSKNASYIERGMNSQQVSSILGKPDKKIFQNKIIKGKKVKTEIWEYSSQPLTSSFHKAKTVMEAVEEEKKQRQIKDYYTGERCRLLVGFLNGKVIYSNFSTKNKPLKREWE